MTIAKIAIGEITVYGHHGVLPEEQSLGQEFRVNLEMTVELPVRLNDRIDETVDYSGAVDVVRRILAGKPRRLLETLARDIAQELLALPGIVNVSVSVCKPHPPVSDVKGGVTVTLQAGSGKGQ